MRALSLCLLVLTACEPPPVYPTADRRQNTELSRVEGSVVVSSRARGNVVVLLFDAARPPPPAGSGRPVTFTVLSRDAVFGAAPDGDTGPFTAPFAFSLVPAGKYLVRGFIDSNLDFIPWYDVTSQVNAGDVGGAAIEPTTRANREIGVDVKTPALDVPVSFSDTALVPLDRPSFAVDGGNNPDGGNALLLTPTGGAQVLELTPLPIDAGVIHQSRPAFLARFIDDDLNGVPDDANKDGVPDFWPKVLVRKLTSVAGANPLLDENDLDKNGVLDAAAFEDYEHFNFTTMTSVPADGKPDAVVLAAGIDPTELAPLLIDPLTGLVRTSPVPVGKLTLVIRPQAFDLSNPLAPAPLKTVPKGRYAITLVQLSGQTWRLPNELQRGIAERFGLPIVESQSFVIEVP
ncbi:MAG: putative lipoprotein [Myxococcaceae bacterium]|nr:putative lipoprotein [Myxococcaceae bacterium]